MARNYGEFVTLHKGTLFFKEDGRSAYFDLGNNESLKITPSVEEVEVDDNRTETSQVLQTITTKTKDEGDLTCVTPYSVVRRLFTGAKDVVESTQASGTLNDQAVTVYKEMMVKIGKGELANVIVKRQTGAVVFTADNTTDVITATAHGFSDGHAVVVSNSGGGLPAGLVANTLYYVRDSTVNTFKLAATEGGVAIDLTSNGTGTHSVNRAYKPDVDYELNSTKGQIWIPRSSAITDAQTVLVYATYSEERILEEIARTKSNIQGWLELSGATRKGLVFDFQAYVKLTPSGDLQLIAAGNEIVKLTLKFVCLANTQFAGPYKLTERKATSQAIAAV